MKRNRKQDGYVFKARGVWYVRYSDTRVIDGEVKRVRIAKQIVKALGEGVTNPATGQPWTVADATAALMARGYSQADATVLIQE